MKSVLLRNGSVKQEDRLTTFPSDKQTKLTQAHKPQCSKASVHVKAEEHLPDLV